MATTSRVALITGCGKPVGIGNSTARALAAAGIIVVVSDVAPTGVANEHNVQGDVDPHWRGVDSLVDAIRAAGGTFFHVSREREHGRIRPTETSLRRFVQCERVDAAGAVDGGHGGLAGLQ